MHFNVDHMQWMYKLYTAICNVCYGMYRLCCNIKVDCVSVPICDLRWQITQFRIWK